jgi:hypothetical protein
MLKFFKRPTPPVAPRQPATASNRSAQARAGSAALPPEPPPLPEVTEGNQESDWALWEDSVAFQDSQMPSTFNEWQAVKVRGEAQTAAAQAGPEPYARIRKHD